MLFHLLFTTSGWTSDCPWGAFLISFMSYSFLRLYYSLFILIVPFFGLFSFCSFLFSFFCLFHFYFCLCLSHLPLLLLIVFFFTPFPSAVYCYLFSRILFPSLFHALLDLYSHFHDRNTWMNTDSTSAGWFPSRSKGDASSVDYFYMLSIY